MLSFKEFIEDEGLDYFILLLEQEQVSELALINEGKWVQTDKKDWMQRVDAENPSIKQQRHVHVARAKHINTKSQQVAWNKDGTKHDSKSFNSKIGSLNIVQSVAKQALKLPASTKLEEATKTDGLLVKINEALGENAGPITFKIKLA